MAETTGLVKVCSVVQLEVMSSHSGSLFTRMQ